MPGKRRLPAPEPGQRFGRGVVIDPEIKLPTPRYTERGVRLRCDCGNTYECLLARLVTQGIPGSCGCGTADLQRAAFAKTGVLKHGLWRHTLYAPWQQTIRRCENPGDKRYKHYGGRGITVCPEWHDVAVFVAWIEANLGPRPDGMSLDRIDNNDGYRPGNVKWSTQAEQTRNQRTTKLNARRVWLTRRLVERGVLAESLRAGLGISKSQLYRVLHRESWRDVE